MNCYKELRKRTLEEVERDIQLQRSRFISNFACKVRERATLAKKNWETMGLAYAPLAPPQCYLKKHSKNKPVWVCSRRRAPCCVPPKGNHCPDPSCEECSPKNPRKKTRDFCKGFSWRGNVKVMNRGSKNFIKENLLNLERMTPAIPPQRFIDDHKGHRVEFPPCKSHLFKSDFGQTPRYIALRKQQLYEQLMIEQMMMEGGCDYLNQRERCAILEALEDELRDKIKACSECLTGEEKARARHGGLEAELCQLENDIRLLRNHKHIFVSNGRVTVLS